MTPTGRTSDLAGFPRPSLAVDVAVATVLPDQRLGVLVHRRSGDRAGLWALPGRFLRERERLAHAVATTLAEKCGISRRALAGRVPRQLHLFDDPSRDDRGWVLSAAHLLALPYDYLAPLLAQRADIAVAPVVDDRLRTPGRQRALPYGQDEIVARALTELRREYAEEPDPEALLGSAPFTLSELHAVHCAVLDTDWQIDTFRRRMLPMLVHTGEVTTGGPGRPAAQYVRAHAHD